jgi:hypothetical protein
VARHDRYVADRILIVDDSPGCSAAVAFVPKQERAVTDLGALFSS